MESHGLLTCARVDLLSAGFGAEKCRPTLAITDPRTGIPRCRARRWGRGIS